MNSLSSVAISAIGIARAIWKQVWVASRICPWNGQEEAITRSCLNAIIVVATILHTVIAEMFVDGVSMAKVGQVVETLTGSQPSASTVSRVFHSLEEEYSHWKMRKLEKRYAYAFADGTYFTVIYNGQGCKMPILAVVGISQSGEREVLAFGVGDRELDILPFVHSMGI
jgi:hypothetical protein